jgi:hypothetical protein
MRMNMSCARGVVLWTNEVLKDMDTPTNEGWWLLDASSGDSTVTCEDRLPTALFDSDHLQSLIVAAFELRTVERAATQRSTRSFEGSSSPAVRVRICMEVGQYE